MLHLRAISRRVFNKFVGLPLELCCNPAFQVCDTIAREADELPAIGASSVQQVELIASRMWIVGPELVDPMFIAEPAVRERLAQLGGLIPSETERNPAAFDRLVRAEIARWSPSHTPSAQQKH